MSATFSVPADHPALPGHFPGQPVVPGVLILEAVQRCVEDASGESPLLWPTVKFLHPLLPGELARIECAATAHGYAFKVWRDETLLASGECRVA